MLKYLVATGLGLYSIAALGFAQSQPQSLPLKGPMIAHVLAGHVLVSLPSAEPTAEMLRADGSALFQSKDKRQVGRWKVLGDKYCSMWPPAQDWTCSDVSFDGKIVHFAGAGGTTNDLLIAK